MRIISPVGVEEPAFVRVHRQRSGFLKVTINENFTVQSIQFGYFDRVCRLVAPIQIPAEPVNGDTVRVAQRRVMDHLS